MGNKGAMVSAETRICKVVMVEVTANKGVMVPAEIRTRMEPTVEATVNKGAMARHRVMVSQAGMARNKATAGEDMGNKDTGNKDTGNRDMAGSGRLS